MGRGGEGEMETVPLRPSASEAVAKEEAVLEALPLGCARDALEEGECFAALGEAEGLLVDIGETMGVNEGEGVEDWQEDAVAETEEEGEL